ncbi:hypothetical protein V7S57_08370 [Caulobacter sp. CCNWLY153]|jgi:hypothetical protein|uniref:Uncharacterized protein n=1 Tax=Caulobacter radicis TaxID=2172650 RepID=A0A2T9IWH5_9CAUL|nr:hypothetical protein [Caulobacter radicis]PVM71318.1 hypothetical protein DDF65_24095 [Caulobacter radicis]
MSVGTELLAVPFPEMVQRLGVGIATAQLQLDLVSLRIARMMAGYDEDADEEKDGEGAKSKSYMVKFGDGQEYSLLELGFTPTFYQFVDTVIELKMSISFKSETEIKRSSSATTVKAGGFWTPFGGGGAVSASSVSASYAAKYQYSAEGSSLMRTKLVPIPPPALFEERVRALIEQRRAPPPKDPDDG